MKRALVLLITVALASTLYADPFADFRIPTHQVYNLTGNFNGSYYGQHANQGTYSQESQQYNGGVNGAGFWLYDSDPLRGQLQLNTGSSGYKERYRSYLENSPQDIGRDDRDLKSLSESWSLSGDTRWYPGSRPIGVSGRLSAYGDYGQMWETRHHNTVAGFSSHSEWRSSSEWRYTYHVIASAGAGYGRVRDASVVYTVHVMESRLLQSGALTRELANVSREKLAALLYAQKPYARIHDRSAKLFWKEAERILREDGALRPEGLEAYDVYRIAESTFGGGVPQGGGFLRQRGFFVGAYAAVNHDNWISRFTERIHDVDMDTLTVMQDTTYSDGNQYKRWSDMLSVGPKAEVHLPWGWRWQFDATSSVLFPLNNLAHALVVDNFVQAQYLIADRWYGSASVHHRREIDEDKSYGYHIKRDSWMVDAGADIRYYVEDRTSLSLSVGMAQNGTTPSPDSHGSHDHVFWRDTQVAVGISYHFLGRFQAPNLGVQSSLPPMVWPWQR